MAYRCLTCGSIHGEATEYGAENWYWRMVEFGRIGPFCRQACGAAFRLSAGAEFTLAQWERLRFMRAMVQEGRIGDGVLEAVP